MNKRIYRKLRESGHVLHEERMPAKDFYSWFTQDILKFDSEEYHREFWHEFYTKGHTIGHVPYTFDNWLSYRGPYALEHLARVFFTIISVGIPCYVFHFCRQAINARLRRYRRPTYYETERARRQALGKLRRAIRLRRTHNACPTVDDIRKAWMDARHNPENALRLGGMLEDLECYVNNKPRGNAETGYRGRYGGIKRHLASEAPDLYAHYTALMRYKSLARKFRQVCQVADPIPTDALLPVRVLSETKGDEKVPLTQEKANGVSGTRVSMMQESSGNADDGRRSKTSIAQGSNGISHDLNRPADALHDLHQTPDGEHDLRWVAHVVHDLGQTRCEEEVADSVRSNPVLAGQEEPGGRYGEIGVRWVAGRLFPSRAYLPEIQPQECAAAVLSATENTVISLEAALALRLDPDCISVYHSVHGASPDGEQGMSGTLVRNTCSHPLVGRQVRTTSSQTDGGRVCRGKYAMSKRVCAWLDRHIA